MVTSRHDLIRSARVALRAVGLLLAVSCGDAASSTPAAPRPVVITSARTLPVGTVGIDYDVALVASGGNAPVAWSIVAGQPPTGFSLSSSGHVTGRPTTAATRQFTARATGGTEQAEAEFTLTILAPPFSITTQSLPDATLGSSYSQLLSVDGGEGPTQWSLVRGALPAGIALSSSGIIAGNGTMLGSSAFTIRATRGALDAERALSVTVVAASLEVTTPSLPNAKAGEPYAVGLESRGGVGGNVWTVSDGSLPQGLTLATDGLLSGTPLAAGTVPFVVTVASGTQRASAALTLTTEAAGYPSSATVTMPTNAFVPFLVQLGRGGTITWRFGAEPHNAIFVAAAGAPPDINISSSVDVSRTFPTVGAFRYECTIHPGMSGIIDVKP